MKRLYIEAGSIAEERISGVGHTTYNLIDALTSDRDFTNNYQVVLLAPFNKVHLIDERIRRKTKIKRIFVPGKIMNLFMRFNSIPYMDLFFGKGVYLFPNFKNWPLARSSSLTYIHDVYFKVEPSHIEPRNLTFLSKNTGRFIKRTTRIITVSNHAKSEIEKYYPEACGKVDVVPNGVNFELFYPRSADEQRIVSLRYGVEAGRYFIFLSNIEPRKNILRVIEAYKLYADAHKGGEPAKLLIVGGNGWNNSSVLDMIKEMRAGGYSIEKPSRYVPDDDLPPLLSGAIALVHPALYEGFGITPLEAMACGTRPIVAKNSSIPEVMGDDYVAYVDEYDTEDISKRMAEYEETSISLEQKQDLMMHAEKFTWDASAHILSLIIDAIYKL